MAKIKVIYNGQECEVWLKKLSRKEKINRRNIDVSLEGKMSVNTEMMDYNNVISSLAKVLMPNTGEDLLKTITRDEFVDALSDDEYDKLVEEAEKENPFR